MRCVRVFRSAKSGAMWVPGVTDRDRTAELLAFLEDVIGYVRAVRTPSWCDCGRRKLHHQKTCSRCRFSE
jgi:hypothetical protein